jgi:O-antigen/teichoic acid export membrane protein
MLWRTLLKQELFEQFNLKTISVPARELFSFTVPLLSSDLVFVLMTASSALLLGYFRDPNEVASFRAVQPSAMLNQFVLQSFTLLFTPMASRMFARDDHAGVNHLYWQTAIWISVLSFPIFAMTFSLAHPITVLLYGQNYEDSAIILALLSFGYYFGAALGFNGLTLKVYGKLRFIVGINILAAVVNVAVNLLLIPRYGAFGAACGTSGTMVAHSILKQVGLRFGTGISLFEWKHFKVYLSIAIGAAGLLVAQSFLPTNYSLSSPYVYISIALAAIVSLVVVGLNRKDLNVAQTFPELLRFPLMKRFFGE